MTSSQGAEWDFNTKSKKEFKNKSIVTRHVEKWKRRRY
jgi:hypothetical protein